MAVIFRLCSGQYTGTLQYSNSLRLGFNGDIRCITWVGKIPSLSNAFDSFTFCMQSKIVHLHFNLNAKVFLLFLPTIIQPNLYAPSVRTKQARNLAISSGGMLFLSS